ncbi:MAG TPA: ribonuclease R [Alphaproteobacteria bacterium]|nr:ribonuclease R [Alphaproteobacteria bacterium]
MSIDKAFKESVKGYFKAHGSTTFTFSELKQALHIKPKHDKKLKKTLYMLNNYGDIKKLRDGSYKWDSTCGGKYRNSNNNHAGKKNGSNNGVKLDLGKLETVLCVYRKNGEHWSYTPILKKSTNAKLTVFKSDKTELENIEQGSIVEVKPIKSKDGNTYQGGKFIRLVGKSVVGSESYISLHNHGIKPEFSEEIMKYVNSLKEISQKQILKRQDLRHLPLITIDGKDSRDFDDAVFAEKWFDAKDNHIGYHVIVAIADVAYYVPKGSPLDLEALKRGNSTYCPDMVVPMLPERLSNGLCSLVPNEDRPVMAVHLYIDINGELQKHKFVRAVIKSHKRLTYDQVQTAIDGDFTDVIDEVFYKDVIAPLESAYELRKTQKDFRGALTIEKPESRILVDYRTGEISEAEAISRHKSHMIIEEMMILANIAAGHTLEEYIGMYRVHEEPSVEKVEDFLRTLDQLGVPYSPKINPEYITAEDFQTIADSLEGRKDKNFILDMMPKSQSKAYYSPDNEGHYALALTHYAHFTSPIRRYADLVVHRVLIEVLTLPCFGGAVYEEDEALEIGEQISKTERISEKAAKESMSRFMARHYSKRIGEEFSVRVSSIGAFGVYVRILETGAEGILSPRDLKALSYKFDEESHTYVGKGKKIEPIMIGTKLKVKLAKTSILSGRIAFDYVSFADDFDYDMQDVA